MVRGSRSPTRSRRSEYPDRDAATGREDSRRRSRYTEEEESKRRRDRDDRRYDRLREVAPYDNSSRRPRSHSRDRQPVARRDSERYPDRDRRDSARGGSSRRSASPRRPRSGSRASKSAHSRSKSPEDKAKPNFTPSGLLAAATKSIKHADGTTTVLKYHEPPEARKPTVGWRLYVFKGKEQVGEILFGAAHRRPANYIR